MTSKRPKYAGHVVHAMNRRVDRQTLFKNDEDYSSFRSLLGIAVEKFDLRLLEWVLMPNHVHFLAWPEEKDTEIIEVSLASIEGVSSVKIEDYRRAFG